MLNRKFINNIKRGLGCAYTELASAKDKESYKDSLLFACTHDCTHEFIVEGSKGYYLYNLICLFDDKHLFKQKIMDCLMESKTNRSSLFAQWLDILQCFIFDGDQSAKDFLDDFYNQFISQGRLVSRRILCYEYLCITMSDVFGLQKTLCILDDIDRLKLNKEDILWFFSIICYRYKNNKRIQSEKIEIETLQTEHSYTFEEFLSLVKGKRVPYNFPGFATETEHQKCLQFLAQSDDADTINKILQEYQDYNSNALNHNNKIGIELLFALKERLGDKVAEQVYNTLAYEKSKQVQQLALQLIAQGNYIECAIKMLMTNYHKDLKDILVSAYKKVKFSFRSSSELLSWTYSFMNTTKKHLPDEILFIAYNKSYDAFYREYLVDCMRKRKLLTAQLIEELKHDSDYDIRKKAYKWAKKMYSQD